MAAKATDASSQAPGPGSSRRLAQQQAQIDEVVEIMKENIDKVLERDKNLSQLDDRADKLQTHAAQFEKQAGQLKRKFWLQNMKMMIIMGVIGTIFIVVVGGYLYNNYFKAIAPALPAIGGGTTIPLVEEELLKPTAAPMTTKVEESTTKRLRRRRKKSTTTVNSQSSTVPPGRNIDESHDVKDTVKTIL